MIPLQKQSVPSNKLSLLETNGNAEQMNVTVFNFEKQLMNLLQDKSLFGNIQNMDVNPDDPFGKYKAKNNYLSTVNSGNRYQRGYKNDKSSDTEFLIPIIFACDETKVSNQGKTSSWPLLFTTSILNQTMRNKPSAWRPLGYIPDLKLNTSINEEKQFKVELKSIRLHQVLKTILKSFVEFQKNKQNDPISLTLGNITKKVIIKALCFLLLVICKEETKWLVLHHAIQTK